VLDGFSATRQIKSSPGGHSSVIIALTASSLEEDRERVLSAGCDDFIGKPYQLDDVYEMLTRHLGIKFIYQVMEVPEPARPAENGFSTAPSLEPLDLSGLDGNLLSDLRQATVLADIQHMLRIIQAIQGQDARAAKTLALLANNFEYRSILALIDQAGGK